MATFVCLCGSHTDITSYPEPYTWVAIADSDYEKCVRMEAEAGTLTKSDYDTHKDRVAELDGAVDAMKTHLFNCPCCGRIFWYRGRDGEYEVFLPETHYFPEPPSGGR